MAHRTAVGLPLTKQREQRSNLKLLACGCCAAGRIRIFMALVLAVNPPAGPPLFGLAHLAILGSVVVLAAVLVLVQRAWLRGSRALLYGLGAALLADTLAWLGYQAYLHQLDVNHLPLELCDITLFLTIGVLFTGNALLFDLVYYWALAGSAMALLTPNIWGHLFTLSSSQFYFAHGLVVAVALYLVGSGVMRPRPGSVARAMLGVNLWAAIAGSFDAIFHTNYMYLRHKPQNVSLLTFLGPWPWYIAAAEPVALALFVMLYWPFRENRQAR